MSSSSRTSAYATSPECCGVCGRRTRSTGAGVRRGRSPPDRDRARIPPVPRRARECECHYIESAARVSGPSLTGRILRRVPRVRTYTQYRSSSGPPLALRRQRLRRLRSRSGGRGAGRASQGRGHRRHGRGVPLPPADPRPRSAARAGRRSRAATGRPVDVLWQTGCTPVDDLPLVATPFLPAADLAARARRGRHRRQSCGHRFGARPTSAAGRFAVVASRLAELGEAGTTTSASSPRNWSRAGSPRTASRRRSPRTTCWPPGPGPYAGYRRSLLSVFGEPSPNRVQRGRTPRGNGEVREYDAVPMSASVAQSSRRTGHGPAVADAGQPAGGGLFTSPPWIAAVCGTYGFTAESRIAVDTAGAPVGGLSGSRSTTPAAGRLLSLPFSDRADPPVPDTAIWDLLFDTVDRGPATRRSRCAASTTHRRSTPAARCARRARPPGTAPRWTPRSTSCIAGSAASRGATSPRPNGPASGSRSGDDLDAVRTMHHLHVRLRKHKYRLLAQPWEFFERIWQEFAPGRRAASPCWPATATSRSPAALFLEWNGVLYYKFGASIRSTWRCARTTRSTGPRSSWASSAGSASSTGASAIWTSRAWSGSSASGPASERRLLTLRAGVAAQRPAQREFGDVLGGLTRLLTERVGARRDHRPRGRTALPLLLLSPRIRGSVGHRPGSTRKDDIHDSRADSRVVVVGQGYVGLPLAVRAVEVGHDGGRLRPRQGPRRPAAPGRRASSTTSPTTTSRAALDTGRYMPSDDAADLAGFNTAVVCVPTPLRDGAPDLSFIEDAARLLAPHLRRGACVVLESTTYPGTTEEVFGPILEAGSGLRAGVDFHLGYSPERIDPGNPTWGLQNTPKIVSGVDDASADGGRGLLRHRGRPDRGGARHPGGRAGEAAGEHLPARQHRAGQRAGDLLPRARHRRLVGRSTWRRPSRSVS